MRPQERIRQLEHAIDECMIRDRRRLHRRLRRLKGRHDVAVRKAGLDKLASQVEASLAEVERRRQLVGNEELRLDLPIHASRREIESALQGNQVVIICGETGSGKTTQLPQICLALGRGIHGSIGHTQPRRLAARAVAARIRDELGPEGSQLVDFQVRFHKEASANARVKLMTDGILLAELGNDPRLERYDTIIIDEAHERSLNIDLLLGCFKQILPRRPELRVIITSATIDATRFSDFFDGAPVIKVSGRQYPVDIQHAPSGASPEEPDAIAEAVCEAVDQACDRFPDEGDLLVFLPGEREIRETARVLAGRFEHRFEILPLYARLSLGAQQKVLKPGDRRRIVLATNVAETSLTVPRIRAVIDTGLVRINRYSARRGIDRLPLEGISQASAAQRAGRAGRIAPGICLRLFSQASLDRRDPHTAPEILRTNLASVILRLADLKLGDIEQFPLIDSPRPLAIRAGRDTLRELGGLDASGGLTRVGRAMASMPVDPRIARMLLAAQDEQCVPEVLVIASGLAAPDPRLRPPGAEQAADQKHAAFKWPGSDFLTRLNIWNAWVAILRSNNSKRRWCQSNSLSWLRMREWREIHDQLHRMLREVGIRPAARKPERAGDQTRDLERAVHRSLLVGLVTQVGTLARPVAGQQRPEKGLYEGPDRRRFKIHPGSGLSSDRPTWLMASELVETTRLWARTVAAIDPAWLNEAAAHLLEPIYGDPEWDETRGGAMTTERRGLRGLVLPGIQRVSYAKVDASVARRMFIDEGLVCGAMDCTAEFLRHNRQLQADIERREARLRRRDLLRSEVERAAFYERRLPEGVTDVASLDHWINRASKAAVARLFMCESDLLAQVVDAREEDFPATLELVGVRCAVRYGFEPGSDDDGMTIRVPRAMLHRLDPVVLGWLVPGLLSDKIEALIRGLDKALRRACQPISETVDLCLAACQSARAKDGSRPAVEVVIATVLTRRVGAVIQPASLLRMPLPNHLRPTIEVLDGDTAIDRGRDLAPLIADHASQAQAAFSEVVQTHEAVLHGQTTLDIPLLLQQLSVDVGGINITAHVALVDEGTTVGTRLVESALEAQRLTRQGLCRLFLIQSQGSVLFQVDHLPEIDAMSLLAAPCLNRDRLRDGLAMMAADTILLTDAAVLDLVTPAALAAQIEARSSEIAQATLQVGDLVYETLQARQSIALMLESGVPPAASTVWEREAAHLDRLFQSDHLHETPRTWLMQYPRWLELMRQRLRRARGGQHGGRTPTTQHDQVARWDDVLTQLWQGVQTPPPVRQLLWLLEEWRVTIESPASPQAVAVSEATLREQWEAISR